MSFADGNTVQLKFWSQSHFEPKVHVYIKYTPKIKPLMFIKASLFDDSVASPLAMVLSFILCSHCSYSLDAWYAGHITSTVKFTFQWLMFLKW